MLRLMGMRRLLLSGLCLALSLAMGGCSPDSRIGRASARGALAQHQQIWKRSAPASYEFTLSYSAMIGPRTARIRVADGRVAAVARVKGMPPLRPFDKAITIDGVFDLLAADMRRADAVRVTYDRTWGFPTSVYVDEMTNSVDDEHGYTLSHFVDLSRR